MCNVFVTILAVLVILSTNEIQTTDIKMDQRDLVKFHHESAASQHLV